MNCTQQKQLVAFPKVRIQKQWLRYFFDHKQYRNKGTLHLFSLTALYLYANFRTNHRKILGGTFTEAPGQWICKLGSLPRILRVHSKSQALEVLDYLQSAGFIRYEYIMEGEDWIRFEIADWKRNCVHLNYNYYSYKGSGFFFFPLPVGRKLLRESKKHGKIVFSELDAVADLWMHTIYHDPTVKGSECMPVVYYADMNGIPLLSYSYLAKRWGWGKSSVGRFIQKLEADGLISRASFTSSYGSVISISGYREMIYGTDCDQIDIQRVGEVLGLMKIVRPCASVENVEVRVENRVPELKPGEKPYFSIRIEVYKAKEPSFFKPPVAFIFYRSRGSRAPAIGPYTYRPKKEKPDCDRRRNYGGK